MLRSVRPSVHRYSIASHAKAEHRMGRNYLKGRDGDRINAVLAAAGYNFGLLLRWLARLLRALFQALFRARRPAGNPPKTAAQRFFTADLDVDAERRPLFLLPVSPGNRIT